MILRKPYAFLIKYFKLIHLIISLLIIFLINKTNSILSFFNGYIRNDFFDITVSDYVNIYIYFSIIIVISLILTMVILMRKKDKPILFYILTIILYISLFGGFIYLESVITELTNSYLSREDLVIARDISRFMLIGEFLFLLPFIIRTLGFDVKKFDFKKDLQELELEESDSEEFELLSPINVDDVNRIGRKKLRELKYYYLENKLFILIFIGVISLFVFYNIVDSVNFSFDTNYKEKEIIKLDNLYTLKIDDSYITNKDLNGKNVQIADKAFLVVKFSIKSNYNGKFTLDTSRFLVKYKDETFVANRNYYKYFSNYGIGYKKQEILYNDEKTFILVYLIPNNYANKKLSLVYNYRYDYDDDDVKMIKKKVKLQPEIIN